MTPVLLRGKRFRCVNDDYERQLIKQPATPPGCRKTTTKWLAISVHPFEGRRFYGIIASMIIHFHHRCVVSSLGKGIAAAPSQLFSIAWSQGDDGLSLIRISTWTRHHEPFQHGEVFVTEDGAETDLDSGALRTVHFRQDAQSNNFTTGQIYDSVIRKERRRISGQNGTGDPAYHQ